MNIIRTAKRGRAVLGRVLSCWLVTSLLAITLGIQATVPTVAMAADPPVDLGAAATFAVLAGQTITNTGPTTIGGSAGGDIGVSPLSSITGFPPGIVSGTIHSADASASQAQTALTAAYLDAAGRPTTQDLTSQDLGGLTLTPGVYAFSSSAQLTGNLILDAQGDPNGVFVFKIGTKLTTASNSTVTPIHGARYCRIFWQVGSSATLGTDSDFVGHIFALTSIAANNGATVQGQLLARNGEVTLDSNTITNGFCEETATPEAAILHVIKNVVNDDGGTGVASDFNIHVTTGDEDVVGSPSLGAGSPGTTYTVLPGTYVVSEDASAAYAASYGGDGDSGGTITLAAGEEATVTITNNDVPAPPAPVMLVAKTADPAGETVVAPGQTIEYSLRYANDGPTTVPAAALADTLSSAVTYQSGTLELNGVPIADSGNYDAATRSIHVALGSVPPESSGVLTFKVTVRPWSASRAGIRNVGSWTVNGVVAGTTAPVYHYVDSLDITKRVRNTSGTTVRTGSVLQWTIVVTNRGIVPATNVVITDSVPARTSYVRNSIAGIGRDDSRAPLLVWNVGTIGVGRSVTLTFKSTVRSDAPNGITIPNRAWVRSDQGSTRNATAVSSRVSDTTTHAVRTSGAEDVTLGLMGLLAMLALGFAWSGRPGAAARSSRGVRGKRVTASVLLSAMLLLGGMEAGASFGLPLPSPGEAISSTFGALASNTAASTPRAVIGGSRVAGRVRIPAIGVDVRLIEGNSMSALDKGVWRQPPSVKPGEAGASVIAGHRISSQFRRLPQLKVGNRVRVSVGRRSYVYRVASISTRKASGSAPSFRTGAKEKLVLYTCVPRWQGNKRTVVVCYRVTK